MTIWEEIVFSFFVAAAMLMGWKLIVYRFIRTWSPSILITGARALATGKPGMIDYAGVPALPECDKTKPPPATSKLSVRLAFRYARCQYNNQKTYRRLSAAPLRSA